MARRFTEAEKQAALADLKDGMTLEQASKKHKCSTASLMQWKKAFGVGVRASTKRVSSKVVESSSVPSGQTGRLMELEDEIKQLRDENQSLRSLMLDGYMAKEQNPKLRQIARTLRDAGKNQLQHIMEIILDADAERLARDDSSDGSESAMRNNTSNGLPRHPSGMVKLRRKADQDA
jgi:transposase-like protein